MLQRAINVTDLDSVKSTTPMKGSLALREMYLWPAWYKPKSNILFTYEHTNRPQILYQAFAEMGKTYTFEDLQKLIREHLDQYKIYQVNIWHNSGRVTLMVNVKSESSFFLHKIKFSDELLDILKLSKKDDYQGSIPGQPVELNDIRLCLNNTDLVYLRCKELDENYILENSTNSDLMAVIPLKYSTDNGKLISYRDLNPLFQKITSRKMVYNLHFTIQDTKGNNLPFHKCIFTILNKP